jgi:hypothetical protein
MPILFNPIAFSPSMGYGPELEFAGTVIARALRNAVRCSCCGISYDLLVPVTASAPEVEAFCLRLGILLGANCGTHPPLVQMPNLVF